MSKQSPPSESIFGVSCLKGAAPEVVRWVEQTKSGGVYGKERKESVGFYKRERWD